VVSSRGEQDAVRAAGAAGATRSLVLYFTMAMAGAIAAGAGGGDRCRGGRRATGSSLLPPRSNNRMDFGVLSRRARLPPDATMPQPHVAALVSRLLRV
jgi:hypothetical protein